MKRCLLLFLSLLLILPFQTLATDVNSTHQVNLKENQSEFLISLIINSTQKYAGCEIALLAPSDVEVKSVKFSGNPSTVGPTSSGGLIWFSFFGSENKFEGSTTAEITLAYRGNENTSIKIFQTDIIYIENHISSREKISANKLIKIFREGADNPIEPLPSVTTPTTKPTNPTYPSGSTTKETNSENTKESASNQNGETEPTGSGATNISESKAMDINNDTKGNSRNPLNMFLLIALILSIVGNCVLGYLYIYGKTKRMD